jgi:hypothetical protein
MNKLHLALCAFMLTTPCVHAFPLCTLQPIIHLASALTAANGISTIHQNTKEHADGSYQMTNITKALTGYGLTAAACAASALTVIYCNNTQ